jgi:3-deoxy-D-manno-octulosonic acid kinase
MIQTRIQTTATGAILFDTAVAEHADEAWFDAAAWRARGVPNAVGRGQALFVDLPFGPCVLRHYRRGGLMARMNADNYLWIGAKRTRAFREFRLLAELHDAGLPVAAPVAARYQRDGLRYRADLITRQVVNSMTLAQRLAAQTLDSEMGMRIGRCIAAFHARGIWHADLNAHNVLLDVAANPVLIDFDRGRKRRVDYHWQQSNINRLRRSLLKLGAKASDTTFEQGFWHPLLAAYHAELGNTALPFAAGKNSEGSA